MQITGLNQGTPRSDRKAGFPSPSRLPVNSKNRKRIPGWSPGEVLGTGRPGLTEPLSTATKKRQKLGLASPGESYADADSSGPIVFVKALSL